MLHHSLAPRSWTQSLVAAVGIVILLALACEKAVELAGASAAPTKHKRWLVAPLPPAEKFLPGGLRIKQEDLYTYVDQMPEYPGGSAKLMRDIRQNLRYPKAALAARLTGFVFVDFVVEKDGTISNPQIRRGILVPASQAAAAQAMHEEALRAVRSLHEYWQPGRWKGQAVRVAYTVPIRFDHLPYPSTIQSTNDQ